MAENTPQGLPQLCEDVKKIVPKELGEHAWYLLLSNHRKKAAILINSPTNTHLASLYSHLASTPEFSTPEAQAELSQRLRDVLLKEVTLVGAPQVLAALIPFAKVSAPPGTTVASAAAASTISPQYLISDPDAIKARGVAKINGIYGPALLPNVFASFGSHSADIQHMELFTVYGLYLSDHALISALETEMIVFVSILTTGLRGPSLWHIRGMGRLLGARGTDESGAKMAKVKDMVRQVKLAAITAVEWCGPDYVAKSKLNQGWPNVGDVLRELGGWGDDDI
ncbi:hypothetical protein DV738_g3612, partial [Chaetothyriales sp. CBS 135597]